MPPAEAKKVRRLCSLTAGCEQYLSYTGVDLKVLTSQNDMLRIRRKFDYAGGDLVFFAPQGDILHRLG